MLTTRESTVVWAWVCPVTGTVLDECWGATKPYAARQSERYLGKRRSQYGEMRAVRVTIEPLSAEEQAVHEAEFEAWLAKRNAQQPPAGIRSTEGT